METLIAIVNPEEQRAARSAEPSDGESEGGERDSAPAVGAPVIAHSAAVARYAVRGLLARTCLRSDPCSACTAG